MVEIYIYLSCTYDLFQCTYIQSSGKRILYKYIEKDHFILSFCVVPALFDDCERLYGHPTILCCVAAIIDEENWTNAVEVNLVRINICLSAYWAYRHLHLQYKSICNNCDMINPYTCYNADIFLYKHGKHFFSIKNHPKHDRDDKFLS